jgi:peptidoglycan LD-endopeptidase LytH
MYVMHILTSFTLRHAIAVLLLVTATLLLLNNDLWRKTRIPEYVGTLLHEAELARTKATFTAHLVAAPPALQLPVPVIGVDSDEIADSYGAPRGADRTHEGIDIFAPQGTPIRSATPGIVMRIGTNTLGGNIVLIIGPGGERYYYAHLDEFDPLLTAGQIVSTSTLIGTVGTTGNAAGTPPHLHFGIYSNRQAINPYDRLK